MTTTPTSPIFVAASEASAAPVWRKGAGDAGTAESATFNFILWTSLLILLAGWGLAVERFGWLRGLTLGWIPAGIAAELAGGAVAYLVTLSAPPFRVTARNLYLLLINGVVLYGLWRHFT